MENNISKELLDKRDLRLHIVQLEAQVAAVKAALEIQTELKKIGKEIGSFKRQVELYNKVQERVYRLRNMLNDPNDNMTEKQLAIELTEIHNLCEDGNRISEF